MTMQIKKNEKRSRLKKKIRAKVKGTKELPRLSVYRSNKFIYAQIIDDEAGKTLVSASDVKTKKGAKIVRAEEVGTIVAESAKKSGITKVVFDRNGFKYTGRIKLLAIGKALKDAKKNLIRIKTTKTMSIPHEIRAKYCSSEIVLFPNKGRGLVVGSAARDILNLAGVTDVTAKVLTGSKNKINNAGATMKALMNVSERAGRKVVVAEDKKEEVSVA